MTKSLNEFREEQYMSVAEFAKYLDISIHTYYKALRGDLRPRLTTMRRIAEKLKVPPAEITEFARKPAG
jgi:transcriptional regulator with XRE-family HTH domain